MLSLLIDLLQPDAQQRHQALTIRRLRRGQIPRTTVRYPLSGYHANMTWHALLAIVKTSHPFDANDFPYNVFLIFRHRHTS